MCYKVSIAWYKVRSVIYSQLCVIKSELWGDIVTIVRNKVAIVCYKVRIARF